MFGKKPCILEMEIVILRIQSNGVPMLMIDSLLIALAMASVVSIGLLFLPAIVEFKKPRDAGPRLIADLPGQKCLNAHNMARHNLEDASKIGDPSVDFTSNFSDSTQNSEA